MRHSNPEIQNMDEFSARDRNAVISNSAPTLTKSARELLALMTGGFPESEGNGDLEC